MVMNNSFVGSFAVSFRTLTSASGKHSPVDRPAAVPMMMKDRLMFGLKFLGFGLRVVWRWGSTYTFNGAQDRRV